MTSTADAESAASPPARTARPKKRVRGPVGPRLPRAAQRQRAGQEGRQPAQRPRAHREHLLKQGFDSIDKADLRGRMRWWGLYTQREEGYDGTFTGDENIDLLEAKYFMMRVRCDAGALNAEQLRTVGGISTEFGRDTADLSDRENVQYHWIEIENVPEIWKRLEAVGLQDHRGVRRLPARRARLAAGRRVPRRGPRRRPRRSTRSSAATSATPSTRTCRASSRPRSPASRTWCTRSTTSRSSASTTPSTAPAWTCGWAADCRPTRCWLSGSAPGCRWTRCPTSGRASPRSSATTATAGCGPRRG